MRLAGILEQLRGGLGAEHPPGRRIEVFGDGSTQTGPWEAPHGVPRPEQSLHGPDSAFGGPVAGGQSYACDQVSDALVSHELLEFFACVTGPAIVLDGLDLQRLDLLDDSSQRLQRILGVIGGEWLNPEVLCPQIDHHDKMRVGSPGLERLIIGAECSCIDCQAL